MKSQPRKLLPKAGITAAQPPKQSGKAAIGRRIAGGVVATLDMDREDRVQERLRELNANLERR
jgi:hypothetical protein